MKVLHTLETFLPVSENWIYPQISAVPGVETAVLCSSEANRELFPTRGAPLFLDPPPWSKGCGIPRAINSLAFRLGHPLLVAGAAARKWNPDLLHAHFGMRGWAMLPLRRKLGVPMVTSFYGVDAWMLPNSALWQQRLRELFEECDRFIAEGPAMRDRLVAIGCPAAKIEVIRLGIDLERVPFSPAPARLPLRVVMIARFVEKKGFPDGLRAVLDAVGRGADLELTIVGDATDAAGEAIKSELHALAATPLLTNRVKFTGFLPPAEAQAILRASHIFLCPSRHAASGDAEGGSPLALTEAMAAGLCCIGTRHCDIPEVIVDGDTGFLCDSGDVSALASALVQVATDSSLRERLARAGRAHIERNFNRADQLAALASLYSRLARRD